MVGGYLYEAGARIKLRSCFLVTAYRASQSCIRLPANAGPRFIENDTRRRNQLESELRAVESALTHYRSAFEIESRLSTRSIS
jgi:hypothetical protein